MQVIRIAADVAVLGGRYGLLVVTLRMQAVDRELRVVPVQQRVVEADLQTLGPERLDPRPDQVPPGRRAGRLVIGQRRVPEAETFVMLGGQDRVAHARLPGQPGPSARVIQVGIEVLEVALVGRIVQALTLLHPLVAAGDGIEPPVNEQAEPCLAHPLQASGPAAALTIAEFRVAELMVAVLRVAELMVAVLWCWATTHSLSHPIRGQTSDDMNRNDGWIRRQPWRHTMLLIR